MNEEKTRVSRYFMYQAGTNVVFGRQNIRYEPSTDKNVFGSIGIETIFPKRKELKMKFSLEEYPNHVNRTDMESNIVDTKTGIELLLQEVNRLACHGIRSILGIKSEDFTYDNMGIIHDDVVSGDKPAEGVIVSDVLYLRKGDIVSVMTLEEIDDGKYEWMIVYNPSNHSYGRAIKDRFRKLWMKFFDKDTYAKRYVGDRNRTFCVPLEKVFVKGQPVEAGTAQATH